MKDRYEEEQPRQQRERPRFNRREFLAQQQATQGHEATTPPTTSREERAAYQPQTERQQRPQREDRPARPPRDPDMTLAQYRDELAKIKWLFITPHADQSYYSVVESMEQQIKLYNMGRRISPAHLEAFVDAQKRAHQAVIAESNAKIRKESSEYFDKFERTGDEELDSFRKACRNFDWTWRYSDDGAVARAGQAREETLLAIVKEKGGLYEAYWKLCASYFNP